MESLSIVLSTVPTVEKGAEIARVLVSERLCACVNILPGVRSIYLWEGRLNDDSEALLVAKVKNSAVSAYRDRMASLHPYQVPEIVAIEASSVNDSYLAWCLSHGAG